MMKVLLAKGADPNLRGPSGANSLTLAKNGGRAELIQLLESHGARP
jgi:ankyrin repeat protein